MPVRAGISRFARGRTFFFPSCLPAWLHAPIPRSSPSPSQNLHLRNNCNQIPALTAEWKDAVRVRQALDDLVEQHLSPRGANPAPRLEAIVLAGQITREAIEWLVDAVEGSLPGSRRLIRTSNPEYRSAFGAACQLFPTALGDGVRTNA